MVVQRGQSIFRGTRMGSYRDGAEPAEAKSALTVEDNKQSLERFLEARRARIIADRAKLKPMKL